LIYCESHFYELTLSAKTVAFVEITRQTSCSYAIAFLFSKPTKFDFLLWLFRPEQKDIFSFLVFHFSVKNWNYCDASIKETGSNAKHIIPWLGINYISEVQRSLRKLRYLKFSRLCGVKVLVHLQHSVSHPWKWKSVTLQNVKWSVTLQNFKSPAKKRKVDHQNLIYCKWKQLHFNVA